MLVRLSWGNAGLRANRRHHVSRSGSLIGSWGVGRLGSRDVSGLF